MNKLNGVIVISEEDANKLNMSIFELFNLKLKLFTNNPKAGWYKYIREKQHDNLYFYKFYWEE